jgi:hypothetical protein
MQSGRQTLSQIEHTIAKLHGDETRLDAALKSADAETERLHAARSAALKELARVKLDEISAGRLVANLDAAERRAIDILADYRHRLAAATDRRTTAVAELEAAEKHRHERAAEVERALAAVDMLRSQAEQSVQATAAWGEAKARFDAADKIAAEAERKAAQARADLGAKQLPYDADPLFKYLWERGFNTSAYQAGNLVRMVDRSMADFIGYSGARANYAMLLEIPVRLGEHAKARRAVAEKEKAAQALLERQAMAAAGVDARELELAEARHKLAAAEATLEEKRTVLRSIDDARAKLVTEGTSPGYLAALEAISAGDAADDVATLYAEARRTATTADEQIVRRIETIDERMAQVTQEISALRRSARELAERRGEVEQVRDRFRSAGYDHPHATFGNDNQIGQILGQVLEGVVRSGILWDILREGFRTRQPRGRPDFGAPQFPFPFPLPGSGDGGIFGGDWRNPSSQGGWFPSKSRRGRDDDDDDDDDDDEDDRRGRDFTTGGSF